MLRSPMIERLNRRVFADPKGSAALIRRLLTEHGRTHWRRYCLSLAFMAVGAACTALPAFLFGRGIDEAYVYRSFDGVAVVAVAMIVIFALKGIASYGQAVTMARIANHIVAENQKRMFDKLLQQNIAFYADRHSSEFAARITFGAGAAAQVLNLLINALGRDLLSLIGLVAVMIYQAPFMSMIGIVVMPPAIFGVRKLIKRVRSIVLTQYGGGAEILEAMQETIQGFRIIKAFNLEAVMRARVYESVERVEAASNKLARVSNRATPLMEALGGIAIGVVFLYAGYRVLVLNAAPGEFVSFIAAFLLAYEPAKRIARLNIDLHNNLAGVQVLFDILDLPDSAPDRQKPAVKIARGAIAFADVGFSYRPGHPVLRDVSFVAQPGEVTAFVGPSGGGKSTIFNLVLALYTPERGAIRIDAQNYDAVSVESIRRNIAYVGQDVFLFRGSVRQNIALGRPDATEADIVAAARAAHADEFVSQFPLGYDTPVGEHGAQLSGGQRQRIAIARALIRNAPVILLDEPTAALDTESERYVQEAMDKLIKGRTTLVIAHRLHTIVQANVIHVVEKGTIVESGNHAALMALAGRYAQFYAMRFSREPAGPPGAKAEMAVVPG
jgi:ABC-type multidrug transport system fused ATPase/permease subunit